MEWRISKWLVWPGGKEATVANPFEIRNALGYDTQTCAVLS